MGMQQPMASVMQQQAVMRPQAMPQQVNALPNAHAAAASAAAKLPVGLLIQHIRRDHRPYTPLDSTQLPNGLPAKRPHSVELLNKLQLFYDLDRENSDAASHRDFNDDEQEREPKRDREDERDRSPAQRKNEFAPPPMQFAPPAGLDGSANPGLGASAATEERAANQDDFAKFRNRQS